MYLILLVLNDPDRLEEVLAAWEKAGVGGITILPSTGLGRIRQKAGLREDLPLIPSLEAFYHHQEDISHTLFTIVDSDALAQKVLRATDSVVGDLDKPGNGILAVLPTASVHGLIRRETTGEAE
ncbi:MAG: hypothetical protein FJZ96_10260 [Chloroflexi bacterium]|nr:hypothetical protein [Chloroflexota bacterium]